jgi:hypothetical protein
MPILREQGVASSNLAAPTRHYKRLAWRRDGGAQETPRKLATALCSRAWRVMFSPVPSKGPAARWSAATSATAVLLALGLIVALAPRPVTVVDGDTVDRWPYRMQRRNMRLNMLSSVPP